MARLTNKQRDNLYKTWLTGKYSLIQLANMFGIAEATVSKIIGKRLKKK